MESELHSEHLHELEYRVEIGFGLSLAVVLVRIIDIEPYLSLSSERIRDVEIEFLGHELRQEVHKDFVGFALSGGEPVVYQSSYIRAYRQLQSAFLGAVVVIGRGEHLGGHSSQTAVGAQIAVDQFGKSRISRERSVRRGVVIAYLGPIFAGLYAYPFDRVFVLHKGIYLVEKIFRVEIGTESAVAVIYGVVEIIFVGKFSVDERIEVLHPGRLGVFGLRIMLVKALERDLDIPHYGEELSLREIGAESGQHDFYRLGLHGSGIGEAERYGLVELIESADEQVVYHRGERRLSAVVPLDLDRRHGAVESRLLLLVEIVIGYLSVGALRVGIYRQSEVKLFGKPVGKFGNDVCGKVVDPPHIFSDVGPRHIVVYRLRYLRDIVGEIERYRDQQFGLRLIEQLRVRYDHLFDVSERRDVYSVLFLELCESILVAVYRDGFVEHRRHLFVANFEHALVQFAVGRAVQHVEIEMQRQQQFVERGTARRAVAGGIGLVVSFGEKRVEYLFERDIYRIGIFEIERFLERGIERIEIRLRIVGIGDYRVGIDLVHLGHEIDRFRQSEVDHRIGVFAPSPEHSACRDRKQRDYDEKYGDQYPRSYAVISVHAAVRLLFVAETVDLLFGHSDARGFYSPAADDAAVGVIQQKIVFGTCRGYFGRVEILAGIVVFFGFPAHSKPFSITFCDYYNIARPRL